MNKHTTIFSSGSCYYSTIYQNRQTTNIIIYASKQRDKRQENTRYNVVHPTWATSTGRLSSITHKSPLTNTWATPTHTSHSITINNMELPCDPICVTIHYKMDWIGLNMIQYDAIRCLMRLSWPYYIPRDVEELLSHITCGII